MRKQLRTLDLRPRHRYLLTSNLKPDHFRPRHCREGSGRARSRSPTSPRHVRSRPAPHGCGDSWWMQNSPIVSTLQSCCLHGWTSGMSGPPGVDRASHDGARDCNRPQDLARLPRRPEFAPGAASSSRHDGCRGRRRRNVRPSGLEPARKSSQFAGGVFEPSLLRRSPSGRRKRDTREAACGCGLCGNYPLPRAAFCCGASPTGRSRATLRARIAPRENLVAPHAARRISSQYSCSSCAGSSSLPTWAR